ncbi:MAG: TonB-dependent receptor [Salinibacter sp.]
MYDRLFWHCLAVLSLLTTFLPLTASAQGRVEGRVLDEETQEPLARVNVVLRNEGERRGTSTDSSGTFRLQVPAGTYQLEVSALGYRTRQRTVEVQAGRAETLTLTLAPRRYSLNEIVVESRGGRDVRSVSTVQQIEPQAIERQDAADVSELAPLVPATHVQTNSRGQTIWYFRNAGDRQVGQFFDGALLNIPWDNRVDISLIPAGVVEEVTVTKGVPSVRYGANVLGGAVNFQSRTLDAPGRRTELSGAVGSAEQRRASVTHLGRTGQWDYTAALQYSARGNQPLPEGTNLQYNQPLSERRVNTDRVLRSGFGRVSRRFEDGGQLGVSLLHVDAEQGVAPEGNARPGQTRYWRYPTWQKSTLIVSGRAPLGTGTSVRGAAWGSRFAQDIADYRSISYRQLASLQEDRDLTAGLRLIGTQALPTGTLTLALNGLTTQHHQTNIPYANGVAGADSVSVYRQNIFSVGTEYKVQVHPRVRLSAGLNLDGTTTPDTGPFPPRDPFYAWGLTSGFRVDAGAGWTLRGAAGRKSRFPTMRELFGAALGKFVPNPGLSPVTAWIGEVGIEHQSGRSSFGATAFLNRVYGTIDKRTFQRGPNAGKEQRINLAGARIYGVETTGRWRPTDVLTLDGTFTWSRPRSFTDTGTRKLDEKPGLLGTGTVTLTLPGGLSVMGQARYTGNVYARNENNAFISLPSSLILDARLSYSLDDMMGQRGGEVYLRADNLTDDAKFIGLGLPGPGRSFRAGVELTL